MKDKTKTTQLEQQIYKLIKQEKKRLNDERSRVGDKMKKRMEESKNEEMSKM